MMTVKLVIKSAAQAVDDFDMDCDLTWTIGDVKNKISETYPSNPKKENQKLIYGGKLLPDHLSLKSVLNPTHEKHIVHIVCPSPINVETKPNASKETASSSSFTVPPPNPVFPPVNQAILNPAGFSSMPGVPVTPLNPGDAFQQYLAIQQMYAQFMTQYLSQYNGGMMPPVLPNAEPEMPAMAVPVQQQQIPQVPAPPQAPLNPPQQRRGQEEEGDHDYLDYMYIMSRAILLFAFLYYYSSFIRVFAVVTMFVILSLYKKMNRQNRQQLEMQRRAAERQRNESAQTQPAPPADIQATESEVVAPSSPTTENEALSQQNEGRSIASVLSTTASLISAFFLSLFPGDPPVPVNVN